MSDAIREAFEDHVRSSRFATGGRIGDNYANPLTQRDWELWQAAFNALQSQTAPAVPEWTDKQCIEFMCHALRHVVYSVEGDSPTCDDIRLGVKAAMLAAPQPDHSPDAGKVVQEGPIDIEMGTGDVLIGDLKGDGFSGVIFYRDSQEFEVGQPHPEMSGIPCNEVNGRIFSVTTSNPESLKVLYRAVGRALDHLGHPPTPAADGGEVEPVGIACVGYGETVGQPGFTQYVKVKNLIPEGTELFTHPAQPRNEEIAADFEAWLSQVRYMEGLSAHDIIESAEDYITLLRSNGGDV